MRKIILAALAAVLATAPAAASEKARIGVLKLASSGPIFIAQEKGYFAAEGVEAELRFFDAAQPIAVAAVSGDVDIGATGLTAGFYNLAGKGALKIIAAQSREERGYPLIAYLASNAAYEKGLRTLDDLKGRSIGITQVGSTFHYSLGLLAEKRKLDLASMRLVPLQSMSQMAAAVSGGQVEAALIPATGALPLVQRGEAKLLGWVGDETPWQLGGMFATPRTIAERRPMLEAFMRGYVKAAREFFEAFLAKGADGKPQEGMEAPALVEIIAKHGGQKPEQVRAAIPFIDPEARLLVRDIYRQVEWYKSHSLVDKAVDAKAILDLSFVPQHLDVPG